MSYFSKDKNENYILDKDVNKMEITLTFEPMSNSYVHREPVHLNSDGHLDTGNSHLVIKDGVNDNHAINEKPT